MGATVQSKGLYSGRKYKLGEGYDGRISIRTVKGIIQWERLYSRGLYKILEL